MSYIFSKCLKNSLEGITTTIEPTYPPFVLFTRTGYANPICISYPSQCMYRKTQEIVNLLTLIHSTWWKLTLIYGGSPFTAAFIFDVPFLSIKNSLSIGVISFICSKRSLRISPVLVDWKLPCCKTSDVDKPSSFAIIRFKVDSTFSAIVLV